MAAASFSDAWVLDYVNRVLAGTQRSIHAEMNRGLGVLVTVASTAPLMGMLGTVIGIVDGAFRGCIGSRAMCMAAAANGISEALMSTGFGLLVALPALWSFNYFTASLQHLDLEAANSSLELTTYLALHIRRLRTLPPTPSR